jgi:hypothetical protein
VAKMGEKRIAYRFFFVATPGEYPLGEKRRKLEENINI